MRHTIYASGQNATKLSKFSTNCLHIIKHLQEEAFQQIHLIQQPQNIIGIEKMNQLKHFVVQTVHKHCPKKQQEYRQWEFAIKDMLSLL